jgi:hypothetical protein
MKNKEDFRPFEKRNMRQEYRYKRLKRKLYKIISSEVNVRLNPKNRNRETKAVGDAIEQYNLAIVAAHKRGRIDRILPTLFTGALQIKANGRLFFGTDELSNDEYKVYAAKKGRLETLVGAALNTLQDEELLSLVVDHILWFEQENRKIDQIINLRTLLRKVDVKVRRQEGASFDNEKGAIAFLQSITPLKSELQDIRSRCAEMEDDPFLADGIKQLQLSISSIYKKILVHSSNASKVVFNQAATLFQRYQATEIGIESLQRIAALRDSLQEYATLFENLADENRKQQIIKLLNTIDGSITSLNQHIKARKQQETELASKSDQEIQDAYANYLALKEAFKNGRLNAEEARLSALKALKKASAVMRSNGRRAKAREIERFLHLTGLDHMPTDPRYRHLAHELRFYKRAFYCMLPLAIGLVLFCCYLLALVNSQHS